MVKWQQPLIFPLEVNGKVWNRVEGGPHHIAVNNELVQNQFHYTRSINTICPPATRVMCEFAVPNNKVFSDVLVGSKDGPGLTGANQQSDSLRRGVDSLRRRIKHFAGPPYDLTLNLQDSATAAIGPS